jgi:predicted PurR-regulated permease PerM
MVRNNKMLVWLLLIVATCFVFYFIQGVIFPFVVAVVLSYILAPLVSKLDNLGCPRFISTIITMVLALLAVLGALLLLFPVLQSQVIKLKDKLPIYGDLLLEKLQANIEYLQTDLNLDYDLEFIKEQVSEEAGSIAQFIIDLILSIVTGGIEALSFISLIVITPVILFYILRDWQSFTQAIDGIIPRSYYNTTKKQLALMNDAISGYIRGQSLVCLTLGLFYCIGLSIAGLDFALAIGLFSGIFSFIPYVGTILGGISSLGIAFAQFNDWESIALVATIYVSGQVLEGYYLSPKFVGERVHLHPVWIIFALFLGGNLYGFLGILIAVPIAAVLGVLIRFLIFEYKGSALYE